MGGSAGMPLAMNSSPSSPASRFTWGGDLPNSSRQSPFEERRAMGLGGSAAMSKAACTCKTYELTMLHGGGHDVAKKN